MPHYQANRVEKHVDVPHASFANAFEVLVPPVEGSVFLEIATVTVEEARRKLASVVGPLEFGLFQRIDHGAVLRALTTQRTRALTYVFGNALIASEMTRHDPRAGLYVPLRLFVLEIDVARVQLNYDLPSATLAQLGVPAIDEVARGLDMKIDRLLDETIKLAGG